MRILVTGKDGQVARSLVERAAAHADMEVVAVGRPELDLLRPASVTAAIRALRPDLVISAAAYTAVDRAEDEPDEAHAVNSEGAGAVASAAADIGAPVFHLSTDYVFSGSGIEPYTETDEPAPRSAYGRTKLAGEQAVAAANPRHVIVRTAWVYSPFGRNFVRTMLRLAADRDRVSVVSDQWGNPTSALDVGDALLRMAESVLASERADHFGVFHMAGAGSTNWSGFASHIYAASRAAGAPWAEVEEIATADFPAKAARPANSRLSTEHLADTYGLRLPHWRSSSALIVERLVRMETPPSGPHS